MQQRPDPRLPEADRRCPPRIIRRRQRHESPDRPPTAPTAREIRASPAATRTAGKTWPASRSTVIGRISRGDASASPAFLASPFQTCAGRPIHPADGQVGGVADVGLQSRQAIGARELQPVVERPPDRRMPAGAVVGLATRDEELAAAGREGRVAAPPHPLDRQETQQDEVHQRDHQLLEQADVSCRGNPLSRSAPDCLQPRRQSAKGFGRQADVGIDEDQQRSIGPRGRGSSRRAACHTSPAAVPRPGRAGPASSRREISATIAAVASSDRSSSTRTSTSTPRLAIAAETDAPMTASSSRAGINTETAGRPSLPVDSGGWEEDAEVVPHQHRRHQGQHRGDEGESRRGGRSFGRIPPVGAVGRSNERPVRRRRPGDASHARRRKRSPAEPGPRPPPRIINAAHPGCPLDQRS